MTGARVRWAGAGRGLALATGLAAAVLAGGCTTAPRPAPGPAALAAGINLRASDLPAGWRGGVQPAPTDSVGVGASLAACLHIRPITPGRDVDIVSAHYSRGPYRAGSEVVLWADPARAAVAFGALAGPGAGPCIASVLGRVVAADLPAGASVLGTRTAGLATPAPAGVRVAGYRITMTVSAMGRQLDVYSDIALLDRGRAAVTVSDIGIGTPFPARLRATIDRRVERRLLAAA